ncbi:MAG: alcohol dehydrogenase catalytic domain-containing protein, partial [Dehalococcoidia bacterium]
MRAVVARGRVLTVEAVPEPEPGPGEVLVRVLACGICGSDLHAVQYAGDGATPGVGPLAGANAGRPVIMGHEFCAEIVGFGPDTARTLPVGQRVTSQPVLMRAGRPVSLAYGGELPGGYAEYMVLSESMLVSVPAHVATEHAALTEPLAVGAHAVARSSVRDDDLPLVIGCGPVGLAVIAALRLRGHDRIVAA